MQDVQFLLVLAVSLVLCLTCVCVLVRSYGRKYRYRGKERGIQRPFIKGKRGSQSPRSPILYGNLFNTNVQSGSPPRRLQYALTGKHSRSPVGHSSLHQKTVTPRTGERNFLGDIIASINQPEKQNLSLLEMRKSLPQRKVEAVVSFQQRKHGDEEEKSEKHDTAKPHIVFHRKGDGSGKFVCAQDDQQTDTSVQSAERPQSYILAYSSPSAASHSKHKEVSSVFSPKPNTRAHQVEARSSRSLFYVSPPPKTGTQGNPQQHEPLWAHNCDPEKASAGNRHKTPLSVKSKMVDTFECRYVQSAPHGARKCETSKGFVRKIDVFSSNYRNIKNDKLLSNNCRDSLDDVPREGEKRSRKRREKRSPKASDREESGACAHKVFETNDVPTDSTSPKTSDIVANASKTEVSCKICGITLSKPQCFYSLGSLCTDGELCETDSDDVNRHPIGDIDDFPRLAEIQSHHDTGYTSSDDFEDESNYQSKVLDAVWQPGKRESTDSYDGDYESDNDEQCVKWDKMSDIMALKPLASVGEPIPIKDYALREWKSNTPTSRAMKKGYSWISLRTEYQHLRQIRGDNYCAIRAVLFQTLVAQLPIFNLFAPEEIARLEKIPSSRIAVDQWSFANRLHVPQSEVVTTLEKFLAFFSNQIRKIYDIPSQPERVDSILSLFNNETEELKILEATKLLMYDTAVQLHRKLSEGEDVPVFSMLLFARDSCESPRDLLVNHLNRTGDTGGLEQVEMCLLGFTLGVVVQVIRPSQVDKEDFIAYYPPLDDVPKYTPTVTLVAEDDRHYNIVV